jgi:Cof subfamily protein (haloacid dehalogenase superfamily)
MDQPPSAIKLIAIDIDGTLLNPQREITPRVEAAIRRAREAGIVVTLATGRRYFSTSQIASKLGLTIPLILCDGSLVLEHPDGSVLHTNPLQAEVAQQVVDLVLRYQLQPVVHHINGSNGSEEEIWTGPDEYDNHWVHTYLTSFTNAIVRRWPIERLCSGQPDPLRVIVFASEEIVLSLVSDVSTLPVSWDVIKRGNYGTAELAVMHPHCSKASGLRALAQHLHIPIEHTMAIGDNTNDIAMLKAAAWGVAMGHASEPVKASADVITASNEEDGVALAIERYALPRASSADSNSRKRDTCL